MWRRRREAWGYGYVGDVKARAAAWDRAESSREGNDEIPVAGEVRRGVDHPLWILPYLDHTVRLMARPIRQSR